MHLKSKSLYISRAVSNFYGTEIEIWAGFGPIMSNFCFWHKIGCYRNICTQLCLALLEISHPVT